MVCMGSDVLSGRRSFLCSGFLGVAGAVVSGIRHGSAAAGESGSSLWTVLSHEGRDYLPLEQVGRFYGLGAMQRSGSSFALGPGEGVVKGHSASSDFHISRLKFILSYPITDLGGRLCISRVDLVKLVEPVLRPFKIAGASSVDTVILDPGHGGSDKGALGKLGSEKDFTLDVAVRAGELLRRAGYRVVYTRSKDEFVPLEERTRKANLFSRAVFVSVHFNSGGNGTGVETYAMSPRGVPSMSLEGAHLDALENYPGNQRDAENAAFATAAHAAMVVRSGLFDRGIKRARFHVLRELNLPGVLLEAGFLSNSEDMRRIASAWYRQQVAGSILEAVRNYRRAIGGTPV